MIRNISIYVILIHLFTVRVIVVIALRYTVDRESAGIARNKYFFIYFNYIYLFKCLYFISYFIYYQLRYLNFKLPLKKLELLK